MQREALILRAETMTANHRHTILCIDDDPDDVDLLRHALQRVDPACMLVTAQNGEAGLQTLRQLHLSGALPCLVVLDINMPVMDGRQTFTTLRREQAYNAMPVVIFSTSNSVLDRTLFSGKNCHYLIKPRAFENLVEAALTFLGLCRH